MNIKNQILLAALYFLGMFFSAPIYSQGVYVGDLDTPPASSAILEAESSSQGILIPRMTFAEIQAISSPAEGLMVYNTTSDILCFYNGFQWKGIDGEPAYLEVGDRYQGGIVYELNADRRSGMLASIADLDILVAWGCSGTTTGATSTTDGQSNTTTIVGACATGGIAARLCDDYNIEEGGVNYDDWYLPARDELLSMYNSGIGTAANGFDNVLGFYWSSTELSSTNARLISFASGADDSRDKNSVNHGFFGINIHYVRAVRAF